MGSLSLKITVIRLKEENAKLKEGKVTPETVDEEKKKLNEEITKLRQEITELKEGKEPTEVSKPEESKPEEIKPVDVNKELEEENTKNLILINLL